MSKTNKTDKLNNGLIGEGDGDELSETSFITNIKIDVSASPDSVSSKEKKTTTSEEGLKEKSFVVNNLATSRSSARTTTLALDPRPYKKRERVYTTIIIILAVALVAQSGLLWMMHLQSISKQTKENKLLAQNQIVLSGANLNQKQLHNLADVFMRKHFGKTFIVSFKNEREALADLVQGQIQLVQVTQPLSTEEKKYLESNTGNTIQEIQHKNFFIGVYVDEANPINELTLGQIKDIYLGKITNWSSLGGENRPIVAGKMENNSIIDKIFQQKLFNETNEGFNLERLRELKFDIEENSSLIGYGEFKGFLPKKTKFLKIKLDDSEIVEPMVQAAINQKYPFVYNTYLYGVGLLEEELDFIIKEVKE